MKKTLNKLATDLKDQEQNLEFLESQISHLESRIMKMTGKFTKFDQEMKMLETLFAFPDYKNPVVVESRHKRDSGGIRSNTTSAYPANIIPFKMPGISNTGRRLLGPVPALAMPGKILPSNIPDYRPFLQRDGLILLAWDKRRTEMGELYTAYWITSAGIPRFYASKPLSSTDFYFARPDHKSYAAEDGIEFYGQEAPSYIVHVAPELMMSNPRHRELRPAHINLLKDMGSQVNFDYKFLLKTDKKRKRPPKKSGGETHQRAGA